MRKRILSLALALAVCLGLMAVPASAAGAALTEIVSADTYDSFGPSRNYWPDFSEGIAWIAGRNMGAIDTTGRVIIAPGTYDNGMDFSDGVAWAHRDGKWCLVDKTGRELFTLKDGLEIEVEAGYGKCSSNFHDGLARVRSKGTDTYGYIDKTGKLVIPCEHNYRAGNFYNGLAVVYDSANAFYGYMDKTGKVVIPCQYAGATDFVNGFAHVQLGNRQTVIDTTGRELISQEYTCSGGWKDDWKNYVGSAEVVLVHQTGGDYAFVNKAGQIVSSGYKAVVMRFADGMVNVSKDGKGGFVNESGVLAIPCTLSGNRYSFRDGYVAVIGSTGDWYTWNILDKTGRVTGTRQVRSGYSLANAGNGCFIIESSESGQRRFGFVDYTGREIVPCKYKAVNSKGFSGGVAAVQNFDGKWGFVDTNGNEVLPCTLSEIAYTSEPGIFIVTDYNGDGRISLVKSSGWTAPAVQPQQPQQPAGTTASPTNDKLEVNGAAANPTVYKINGSNYFKIRDVAALLNGTEKQFAVGYDGELKSVTATTGQGYAKQSGDLAGAPAGGNKTAAVSNDAIYVDGVRVEAEVYKIDGSNYFKLRDLGKALDFYVGWEAGRGMYIETDKPYS